MPYPGDVLRHPFLPKIKKKSLLRHSAPVISRMNLQQCSENFLPMPPVKEVSPSFCEASSLIKNPEIHSEFFVCFGCYGIKKDLRSRDESSGLKEIPASNYSPALYCAVPSSWRFLTIVFGMGTCVTPSLWTPEKM